MYMYIEFIIDFVDILFWTNSQVIKWVESIGLKDHAHKLIDSGIHGGILALDYDFDADGLALALQVSPANQEVRGGQPYL